MHKLGLILLEQHQAAPQVQGALISVMSEAASLQCCITAYNVHTLKRVLSSRIDDGQPVESNPSNEALHTQLLVSCLVRLWLTSPAKLCMSLSSTQVHAKHQQLGRQLTRKGAAYMISLCVLCNDTAVVVYVSPRCPFAASNGVRVHMLVSRITCQGFEKATHVVNVHGRLHQAAPHLMKLRCTSCALALYVSIKTTCHHALPRQYHIASSNDEFDKFVLYYPTNTVLSCSSYRFWPCDPQQSSIGLALQAVIDLTKHQVEDLLYLRRMCLIRRGQLARERKARFMQLPVECFSDKQMPLPTDGVITLQGIGAFIRANSSLDYHVWSETCCTCLRGLTSPHPACSRCLPGPYCPPCAALLLAQPHAAWYLRRYVETLDHTPALGIYTPSPPSLLTCVPALHCEYLDTENLHHA